MARMTNFLEGALANAVCNNQTYTGPTNLYLGLYTANPGETGAGTEVTGNGYARQLMSFTVSNGVASTNADITFTASTGNTIDFSAIGISDASTGGNVLFYNGTTATSIDDTGLTISAGDISITFD